MPALITSDHPAMRIGWMRHGTSHDGEQRPRAHARPDTELSERGRAEALAAAEQLRDQTPSVIITSSLRRAATTAELLAEELGVPLVTDVEELVEWRAPTCVLGVAPADYPPEYRHWRAHRENQPHTALPGGESLVGFSERAEHARCVAHRYAEEFGPGPVIAVSHQLLIGAVAAHRGGVHQPADVFAAATQFRLAPATVWWTGI